MTRKIKCIRKINIESTVCRQSSVRRLHFIFLLDHVLRHAEHENHTLTNVKWANVASARFSQARFLFISSFDSLLLSLTRSLVRLLRTVFACQISRNANEKRARKKNTHTQILLKRRNTCPCCLTLICENNNSNVKNFDVLAEKQMNKM